LRKAAKAACSHKKGKASIDLITEQRPPKKGRRGRRQVSEKEKKEEKYIFRGKKERSV